MYTQGEKFSSLSRTPSSARLRGLRGLGVLACVLAGAASVVRAEVLVSYDFRGADGEQAQTEPAQVAAHLEASAIGRGAAYAVGVRVGMTQDSMSFVPEAKRDPLVFMRPYTVSDAVVHDAYFEITLKPEDGHSLSVHSITLGTRRASRRSGPNQFEVRGSLDGFATPLTPALSTAGMGGNESLDLVVDFGRALENLHTAVTLRFYGFGRGLQTDQPGIWAITNPATGPAVIEGRLRKKTP